MFVLDSDGGVFGELGGRLHNVVDTYDLLLRIESRWLEKINRVKVGDDFISPFFI
jgi:hypothetical protein